MIYFTEKEIDDLILEDVPFSDVTTSFLRLENKPAKIQISTRASTVVCCTEEVLKIFQKVGIQTTLFTPSGEHLEQGVKFLEGEGLAKNIHGILRACESIVGFASGIATRTRQIVEKAASVNPDVTVSTSRKMVPYTRKISIKAVKAGGASIHRLGLSETILILESHYAFMGGISNLEKRLHEQRTLAGGKLLAVEVKNTEDAYKVAGSGIDIIQLDKFAPGEIRDLKEKIRKLNPRLKLAAAGNITIDNVEDYSASGADILVTSWPYYGKAADIGINVSPILDL